MSNTIKYIYAEAGEECCNVDTEVLHETLLKLPAEKYIELYRKMQKKMEWDAKRSISYHGPHGPSAEDGLRIAGYSEEFIEIEGVMKKNA